MFQNYIFSSSAARICRRLFFDPDMEINFPISPLLMPSLVLRRLLAEGILTGSRTQVTNNQQLITNGYLMRNILLFFILVFFIFPSTSRAQEKHSAQTLYPIYKGLVMGYQGWFRAAGDGSAAWRYAYGQCAGSSIEIQSSKQHLNLSPETLNPCKK
jgi:hypothetical protein